MTGIDDPRTYFAAERTFLAWIRTGLGLMGVGFAVARFGFFLREIRGANCTLPPRAGAVGLLRRGAGDSRSSGECFSGDASSEDSSRTASRIVEAGISPNGIALGLLLAVVGGGISVYLLLLH
jgi:putative membrane protein